MKRKGIRKIDNDKPCPREGILCDDVEGRKRKKRRFRRKVVTKEIPEI